MLITHSIIGLFKFFKTRLRRKQDWIKKKKSPVSQSSVTVVLEIPSF